MKFISILLWGATCTSLMARAAVAAVQNNSAATRPPATTCRLVADARLALGVHYSNLTNAETTRTPNGGAYQPKELICNSDCEIINLKKFKKVYLPGNPDADAGGYVTFPDIDRVAEYHRLSTAAQFIKDFAAGCPTVSHVVRNSNSAVVEYNDGAVRADTFNFKADNTLVSWVRKTADGRSEVHNF